MTEGVEGEGRVVDTCEFGIVEIFGVEEIGSGVVEVWTVGGNYGVDSGGGIC